EVDLDLSLPRPGVAHHRLGDRPAHARGDELRLGSGAPARVADSGDDQDGGKGCDRAPHPGTHGVSTTNSTMMPRVMSTITVVNPIVNTGSARSAERDK